MTPEDFLDAAKILMAPKRADYVKDAQGNPFENFEKSGEIASWFSNNSHKSFAVLIGTKLSRIASLLELGKKPNNEALEDSFKDLINYVALFGSYVYREQMRKTDLMDTVQGLLGGSMPSMRCNNCDRKLEGLSSPPVDIKYRNKTYYFCSNVCRDQFDYSKD